MEYIGIDLHKRSFRAVVMGESGKVLHNKSYPSTTESIGRLVRECRGIASVVVEATNNWMWMVDEFERRGYPIILAHPLKTKAIASARIKTDTIDATTLAHLLRSDLVPKSLHTYQ